MNRTEIADGALAWAPLIIVVLAAAMLLFGDHSLADRRALVDEVASKEAEAEALQVQNDRYEEQIKQLQENPVAIERQAREDLGMVRPGDTVFRFVPQGE